MDKAKALERVSREIENCEVCKTGKSGKAVVGEGNPDADIVFIGEAPGRKEAATGRPFIGRSGQLLRLLIRESGLKEENCYITSPVKYLPDRGTPNSSDIAHGKIHLDRQLEIIKPKFVVLLGNVAARGVLGEKISISKIHGTIKGKDNIRYYFMFHPAAALRATRTKIAIIEDFEKLKRLSKR